ncbi:MAG: group 1 glycosyl transferase, partial [Microgenomates group bacterium Gr01-1014_93]
HMNPIWMVLGGMFWRLMNKKIFFWYTSGGVTTKLKLAEKFSDVIFTASKESFRLPSKKVIVTGHGIDTELFRLDPLRLNLKKDQRFNLWILSVGRISPVKNYETLVGAAKILKDRGIDFQVTMVGEAPLEQDKKYEESLKFKVKSLKLEDNFNFVGKVNHKDLPQYYQSHDVFVHLSKTGSLDKTILEAMACGMKVLSSSDSARSFLSPELLFDEFNSLELATKIVAIKNRPTDLVLREYVIKNHNLDNLINKISEIIKS